MGDGREGLGEEGCGGAAAGREKVEVLELQVDTWPVGGNGIYVHTYNI